MPNAAGRQAAKKTTPAAKPADAKPADAPKAERHVRSPLERAQAVYDKAKTASDKITAKLADAEKEVKQLKAEADEAKVTLDWAANHPLLVRARRDAGEEPVAPVDWDIDNNAPAAGPETEGRMQSVEIDAGPPELREFTGPVSSTVPEGEGDDGADDDTDGEAQLPPFDFDAALSSDTPAAPAPAAPAGNPFETGPQTTHV